MTLSAHSNSSQVVRSALRILISLSINEHHDFFPENSLESSLHFADAIRCSAADSNESWADEIERWRPDVIVGAWSTRPLPIPRGDGIPVSYYCHLAGSVRRIVARELLQRGMVVTNWGNSMARFVAEAALMLTLAGLRQLAGHQLSLHVAESWHRSATLGSSLFGRRIGLHGFGAIAREFVRLVEPFKPELESYDPFVESHVFAQYRVKRAASLESLFARSEVLVELCALTEETRGSVTGAMLDRLPLGALFVNVARGQLVDEAALADRVSSGRLHAALDVFEREPLPTDSPLRGLTGAVLMPHVSGNIKDSRLAAARFALDNLRRYSNGQPLQAVVTVSNYDRMT